MVAQLLAVSRPARSRFRVFHNFPQVGRVPLENVIWDFDLPFQDASLRFQERSLAGASTATGRPRPVIVKAQPQCWTSWSIVR